MTIPDEADAPTRGDAARRRAHVRAEGVAPRSPTTTRSTIEAPTLGAASRRAAATAKLSSSASRTVGRPRPGRLGSSARATSIAASSRAPISRCASGCTGCSADLARLDRRRQARLDQAEAVARRRSPASGPSRAPRGRRAGRSAAAPARRTRRGTPRPRPASPPAGSSQLGAEDDPRRSARSISASICS